MDALTILLIVLAVIVVIAIVFAVLRSKQRSGSVLAAPDSTKRGRSDGS